MEVKINFRSIPTWHLENYIKRCEILQIFGAHYNGARVELARRGRMA